MKLGTQTNSFVNHMMARGTIGQPEACVGMGATVLAWTDRRAATIISVEVWRRGTLVTVQRDIATRTDRHGMSECQSYEYQSDTSGRVQRFWFGPDATAWREVTDDCGKLKLCPVGGGNGLMIGKRQTYHDFSF